MGWHAVREIGQTEYILLCVCVFVLGYPPKKKPFFVCPPILIHTCFGVVVDSHIQSKRIGL